MVSLELFEGFVTNGKPAGALVIAEHKDLVGTDADGDDGTPSNNPESCFVFFFSSERSSGDICVGMNLP